MSTLQAVAVKAPAAAPVIRRAVPSIMEVFRNGTLHQPLPPAEVAKHIAFRRTTSSPASIRNETTRYSAYYKHRTSSSACYLSDKSAPEICKDSAFDLGLEKEANYEQYTVEEEVARRRRRLTVLFTWLGAKERYAHKYIDLWTQRGHTVLHITCSIRDLLLPKTGAEVTAARVRDHIASLDDWRVLVHGLSVGGFITQHVLKNNQPEVDSKISHQIYDSFTNLEGLAEGVENAVPPRYSGIAKNIGKLYLKHADLSSFNASKDFILNGKANSPVFYMHSLADRVAQYEITQPLIRAMQQKTPVDLFIVPEVEQVPHVALLRMMGPPSYMEIIETFLEQNKDPVE